MAYLQNPFKHHRKLVAALPFIALLLFTGCQSKPSAPSAADGAPRAKDSPTPPTAAAAPEANVFVDEAMLARPYAVIGGTVQNVGAQKLEKLSVEIELRRREDGTVERREVAVEPSDLEPGKQGRYKLKVLSEDWSGSRVVSLRSGARPQEVAFKSLPGAKRPPEKVESKVVVVKPPAQKKADGGEFINTPDTPYKVP